MSRPLRVQYTAELEQIRLQIEVMAMRVGEAVDGACEIVVEGGESLAAELVASDDAIDAMAVSLTERCYELIGRQGPVASDLRFLVSALRMLEELERIGDLALRVAKLAPEIPEVVAHPAVHAVLVEMAHVDRDLYRRALTAWSVQDLDEARDLAARSRAMDDRAARLLGHIRALDGPDAASVAVTATLVGRALDRIADHAVIIGERLRYLLTGDPRYLEREVR